jgi:hypothetical protein
MGKRTIFACPEPPASSTKRARTAGGRGPPPTMRRWPRAGAAAGSGEGARGEDAHPADRRATVRRAETEIVVLFKKPDAASKVPDEFFKRGPPRS